MTAIYDEPTRAMLKEEGWVCTPVGFYKSGGIKKEIEGFELYVRKQSVGDFFKKVSKTTTIKSPATPVISASSAIGSNPTIGEHKTDLTPNHSRPKKSKRKVDKERLVSYVDFWVSDELCSSGFERFNSLMMLRSMEPSLVISFDSEWEWCEWVFDSTKDSKSRGRTMLSWQCSCIWKDEVYEFVFLKAGDEDLSTSQMLGFILDHLKIKSVDERAVKRYEYCDAWDEVKDKPITHITKSLDEAQERSLYIYRGSGFEKKLIGCMDDCGADRSKRNWSFFRVFLDLSEIEPIPVTLLSHAGVFDISSLSHTLVDNLLKVSSSIQGGLVSLHPKYFRVPSFASAGHPRVYPLVLDIRVTMCLAPEKKKKLSDLGSIVGLDKIDIGETQKEDMAGLMRANPSLYMTYSSRDALVTLLYAGAVCGFNRRIPRTLTSASAGVVKMKVAMNLAEVLGVNWIVMLKEKFDCYYRGLERVKHGKVRLENKPGFIENSSLEPINHDASIVQRICSDAFHGGFNCSSEIGCFPLKTYDYDLKNAYPTAMALVPDLDWANPIKSSVFDVELDLSYWKTSEGFNPLVPFVGYVRFQFPQGVKYPCIPVNIDGVPVYPLSSEGLDGCSVSGPYIYLALRLGAKVYCKRGYFLNTLWDSRKNCESKSLGYAIRDLINDRDLAKKMFGKGSLLELLLKVIVNSAYGKTAQDVIEKHTWSAYKEAMEDIGCSCITNPFSAMMTTSIVQCELIASLNQLSDMGYHTPTCTTDGFVGDCSLKTIESLDMYGFKPFINESRKFLTGDESVWEVKHEQCDLMNLTTRGNVSCNAGDEKMGGKAGVFARNSYKTGYGDSSVIPNPNTQYVGVDDASDIHSLEKECVEERKFFAIQCLTREGPIRYMMKESTEFKELAMGETFVESVVSKGIRMDFDMKRKPIRDSFSTDVVTIDSVEYTMAHFDTEAYETVGEFKRYRSVKECCNVLRTESDWEMFWMKLNYNKAGNKVRDKEWAILNSCVMGHRSGHWVIPGLETGSVSEKCAWINAHNNSKKSFKESDWKNANRPERQSRMLPRELLVDKLKELGVDGFE